VTDPATMAAASEIAQLNAVLPVLEEETHKAERRIRNRVFVDINGGKFTPEKAYQAWLELHGAYMHLKSIKSRAKMAISKTEKVADALEIGE